MPFNKKIFQNEVALTASHNPKRPNAPCQKPKITSSAANARMPVTAPKKISERSSLRMLSRQLNCDGKIRTPVRHKTYTTH
jgi:hypothetical protein